MSGYAESMMGQHLTPQELVCNVVKLYPQVICPSEMWLSIARSLTPPTTTAVLDSLPQDAKDRLRSHYRYCPPAAYIQESASVPGDEDFQAVCVQIVRWCEASGPPPRIPDESDGLIRVRVEGGSVREWRPWKDSGGAV